MVRVLQSGWMSQVGGRVLDFLFRRCFSCNRSVGVLLDDGNGCAVAIEICEQEIGRGL